MTTDFWCFHREDGGKFFSVTKTKFLGFFLFVNFKVAVEDYSIASKTKKLTGPCKIAHYFESAIRLRN